MARLPPVGDLPGCSAAAQAQVLDLLFEPSPAIHAALAPVVGGADYASYPALIDACHARLLALAADSPPAGRDATLLSVLGSHPRLGAKRVESAQSAAEQASLGGEAGGEAEGEADALARLNDEYEAAFPGLRYVVFVAGRGRPDIMADMRARIDRADYAAEVVAALQAMCDIAKDRASRLPIRASEATSGEGASSERGE